MTQAGLADVLRRLELIEAEREIVRTIYQFGHTIDYGLEAEWLDCFLPDGDALVVVASNGGSDYVPAWWLNLRSNPEAEIELGRERTRVRAREASPAERARLWPEFTSRVSAYAKYATRTAREIPVVILTPRRP